MCIKLNNKLFKPNINPIDKCLKVSIKKNNLHFQIDNFISVLVLINLICSSHIGKKNFVKYFFLAKVE